ncbi:MAG: hypothetical protein DYG83_02305 [Candidatus Brocadia sp. AMX2]|nr:MAG: hypothetical protein EDM70_03295 [Candidatus Brocadia sp. AMX2]MBC6930885.1 hypothetical protein [Candidatus Brocadia sp.]MBL1167875.1 hypothetical protein [Candidatus Brocadia sp. AMX1]GIK13898.1 MAG: hypothetical protein BroJett002_26050 [Candidatus Brocadia sinica]MCE7865656.1 hypothetical protein [Candidatus Brocadia sp. AMX2]
MTTPFLNKILLKNKKALLQRFSHKKFLEAPGFNRKDLVTILFFAKKHPMNLLYYSKTDVFPE